MREIKFRVWNLEEKCWDNPALLEVWDNTGVLKHLYDYQDAKTIIQQYTGLRDKNNKEIYEGDIVNFYTPGQAHGPEREDYKNQEVWYDVETTAFLFGKFYYDGWHGYTPYEIKDIEVVGNIFENPELISEK